MKRQNIFNLILLLLTIVFFISCEDDITRDPSPETNPNTNKVYFPEQIDGTYTIGLEVNSIEVQVAREISSQALTVSLHYVGSDLISVPSSVSFESGSALTSFFISIGDIELMETYPITINIDGEQADYYSISDNVSTLSLNILKEDFEPYASGAYYSDFFEQGWEAILEYSPLTEQYRFSDCWVSGYDVLFKWDGANEDSKVMMQGTPNSDKSYIFFTTGYMHPSYGMVSAYYPQANINYYDKATKTFTFPITWRVSAGSFGEYLDTFTIEHLY